MQRNYTLKKVYIGPDSQRRVKLMRWLLKPLVRMLSVFPRLFTVRSQISLAGRLASRAAGLPVGYEILGRVPAITLGELDVPDVPVVLYLHGGGFLMPAIPKAHIGFHARLCRDLGAVGVMPDYRLAPLHAYPAALDDCEIAYRDLLARGIDADRIVLAGESAGGNLVLGLLQRLRRHKLPMPRCAVPISAVTEVARVHAPPSRRDKASADAMIPITSFSKLILYYAAGADGSDPELSPVFADYGGFPPLYFIVGEDEILLDDTLLAYRQAQRHGVRAQLDVWPVLPHAFPLMEGLFAEAAQARADIVGFVRGCEATKKRQKPRAVG